MAITSDNADLSLSSILKTDSRYAAKGQDGIDLGKMEEDDAVASFVPLPHPLREQAWVAVAFVCISVIHLVFVPLTVLARICRHPTIGFVFSVATAIINICAAAELKVTAVPAAVMAIVASFLLLDINIGFTSSHLTSSMTAHRLASKLRDVGKSDFERQFDQFSRHDRGDNEITSIMYTYEEGSEILKINMALGAEIVDAIRTVKFWHGRSKIIHHSRLRDNLDMAQNLSMHLERIHRLLSKKEWVNSSIRQEIARYAGFIALAQEPSKFKDYLKVTSFPMISSFSAIQPSPDSRISRLLKRYSTLERPKKQFTWYTFYLCSSVVPLEEKDPTAFCSRATSLG